MGAKEQRWIGSLPVSQKDWPLSSIYGQGRNVDKKWPTISIDIGPTKVIKRGNEKETNSCLKWASFNLDEHKS